MPLRIKVLPNANVGLPLGEHVVEHLTQVMRYARDMRYLIVLDPDVAPVEEVVKPAPKAKKEPESKGPEPEITPAPLVVPPPVVTEPVVVAPVVVVEPEAPVAVPTEVPVGAPVAKPDLKVVEVAPVVEVVKKKAPPKMPNYQEMTTDKLKDLLVVKKIKLPAKNPYKRDMVAALEEAWAKENANG